MKQVVKRVLQVCRFALAGGNPLDAWNLAVLGVARGHVFSGADLLSRIGRHLYPHLEVRPSSLRGLVLTLNPANLSHLVVAEEVLIENVYDLTKVPFEPDVIVDCGAHIGMFTLLAASTFPAASIVCYEPDLTNLEWLRRQVQANDLFLDIVPAAATTVAGEAPFFPSSSCGGTLVRGLVERTSVTSVQTVRLASQIAELNPSRLLLKIDVEGEEVSLLPDIISTLPRACALFLETHDGAEGWVNAERLLCEHGFEVTISRQRETYTDGFAVRSQE